MKIALIAAALMASLTGTPALAEEQQAAEARPDNDTSFNAAIASDYRYRGISQARLQPALQGGFDYVHNPSGFYAGTWLSSIKWTRDAGGGGHVEWDSYAGKRGQLSADVSYDVGVLGYVYPSNGLDQVAGYKDANTAEVYGQLGYGPAYLKYSHAVTNLFGFVDSRNSGYVDLGANIDAGNGLTVNLHAGHQDVRHNGAASYSDWKLGLTQDFGVLTGALALIGTNASESAYASPASGKFLGKTALVLSISKVF
ncbi:TorF family putative porin [Oxalobacteraceae bacterium A2-2]